MPTLISARTALPVAFAAIMFAASPAAAQEVKEQPATINVTGTGEASVAPDMAVVSLTVLREGETAREALDASNEAMDAVLSAMREEGVEDRDLQTAGFSIQPRYTQPGENETDRTPRISGYEVANTLTVRLRELDRLGGVLDQAVSLGVNQGGNINFTNDDPKEALAEARREAVEDAVARAETLAEAAGVSVGRVLRIDENMQGGGPIPMARMEARAFAADASVPIAQGENDYEVTVSMSFEIEEGGIGETPDNN